MEHKKNIICVRVTDKELANIKKQLAKYQTLSMWLREIIHFAIGRKHEEK